MSFSGKKWGTQALRFAAALAVMGWVGLAAAESVDEIVDGHIKAIGGMDAIKKIESVKRKGEVAVSGMFGDMAGVSEIAMIPWKKAYQNMDLGMFAQKMGWNGKDGWSESSMEGQKKLEGTELGQVKQVASIDPLAEYKIKKEGTLAALPDEKVGDADQHVLELTPKEGPKIKFYIDKATKLLTQATLDQDSPQFGQVKIVLGGADFAEFGGVKLPKKSTVNIGDGQLSLTTTYTETKINEKIDDKIFEMPPPPPPPPAAPAAPAAPAGAAKPAAPAKP